MIGKISTVLSILAIGVSIYCLIFLNGKITEFEENTEKIKILQQEAEKLALDKEEFNKQHGVKYSRERAKNQLLEEQKFEAEKVLSQQTRLLEETKSSLESLTSKKLSLEENIESAKLELQAEMKNFEKMLTDAQSLQVSIPQLEQNKDQMLMQIQDFERESENLSLELSSYEKITIQLKDHYESTIDAIFKDKTSRNWLERGEYVTASLVSVDLKSGFLGLSVGKEHGIFKDKLFAAYTDGKEICKIRISFAEIDKSVGSIVPLIGEPSKLLQLDEIDLYHL